MTDTLLGFDPVFLGSMAALVVLWVLDWGRRK